MDMGRRPSLFPRWLNILCQGSTDLKLYYVFEWWTAFPHPPKLTSLYLLTFALWNCTYHSALKNGWILIQFWMCRLSLTVCWSKLPVVVGFEDVLPHRLADVGQVDHGPTSGLGYGFDADVSHNDRRGLRFTFYTTLSSNTWSSLSRGHLCTDLLTDSSPCRVLKPNVRNFNCFHLEDDFNSLF